MTSGRTGGQALNRGVRNTVIVLALTAAGFYVGIILMMGSAGP